MGDNNKNTRDGTTLPDNPDNSTNNKNVRMNVRQIQQQLDVLQAEYEAMVVQLRDIKTADKKKRYAIQEKCDRHLYQLVHDMSAIQCTHEMIETILGLSKCYIKDHEELAHASRKGREKGLRSLLGWQFETASRGSHSMQIWLGKNYLHQLDRIIQQHEGNVWEELLGEVSETQSRHKQTKAPKCDKRPVRRKQASESPTVRNVA
jgi:hypothetical protein